jgi:hypothetical protein
VSEIGKKKVFALRMIQGRNPDWAARPFFARYDENVSWFYDLRPAFSDKFFFEDELDLMLKKNAEIEAEDFE